VKVADDGVDGGLALRSRRGGSCASLLYGIAPKAGALIAAWTLQGVGAVPDAEGFAVLQASFCQSDGLATESAICS
jgi:hypothetical protein